MPSPTLMLWRDMISVGRIVRPRGNRGEVVVESLTDFGDDRFRPGATLFAERDARLDEIHVTSSREQDGRWVVGLAGVSTIDQAESLRGLELRIPPDQLRALEPGRHYVHDLVGCRVETASGQRAGEVQDVRLDTGVPLLVVTGDAGEVLIPFTEEICRRVDTAGKLIRIEPPEGLLEVNQADVTRRPRRKAASRQRAASESEPPARTARGLGAPASERVGGSAGAKPPGLKIDIITIFPRMVEAALAEGVIGRARERGLIDVRAQDLRQFTEDRHRIVDDVPYGGGPGMVMKPEPIFRAVEAISAERGQPSAVILMTPQGRLFNQAEAERLSRLERLIVICGRYEGVDERVAEALVTDELSIGDYVLTGGELPGLVVIDAVARLCPGVVGDAASVARDSFMGGLLDHPHYTRPAAFRGMAVPEVLVSGHHGEIERWRRRQQLRRTWTRRPELMASAALSESERHELEKVKKESDHESD